MSDEKKETKPLTGRTAWDFAAEVTQRLGLSILILIGIAYGFYKYHEATKSMQERLNATNKELRETSVAIGDINKTMIENIKGGLSGLDELQSRLDGLKEQTVAEAKKAADAIALQKEADEARVKAANELKEAKLEYDRLQKLRIAKSGPFKEKVQSLISSLLSDESLDDPDIEMLAKEIRRDYLVDPLVLFQAVAKDPNVENLERLNDLDGLKIDVLMKIIKENETGFTSWMHLHKEDLSDSKAVVGVVKVSEDQPIGFVSLGYDNEQRRVWEIDVALRFAWVYFPSVHNWDVDSAAAIFEGSSGDFYIGSVSMMPPGLSRGQIHLSDAIRYGWANEDYICPILAGENPNLKLIALDDLRAKEPATFRQLAESRDEASTAAMMIRKAETFSAATVVPVSLGRGTEDFVNIRATIIQTLDAAVRRDAKKRQNLALKNFSESNWGRIAAVALRQQFTVRELEVSADRLEISVICSFQDHKTEEIFATKMNFRREQALPESKWRIIGFLRPEPRQSALQKAY